MKLIKLTIFLLCLLSALTAVAEPKKGYDVLGLAKYCDAYLKAPKLPAVSTLLGTFGDPLPCIEKRIAKGGLEAVQIDLIDATCWRNHNCAAGVSRPDDLKEIQARAAKVNVLAVKYPAIKWWLSPALEHDVKDANKVKAMHEAAKKGCPNCSTINSPMSGAKVSGIPNEFHGNGAKAFSISNDGSSIADSNSAAFQTQGKEYVFGWLPEFNGRVSGEKKFETPMKRTCWPTADLFAQVYYLLQTPETENPFPAACKAKRVLKGNEIWKTNAETYSPCPPADKRGNKPLLISGYKDAQMSLINAAGKQVGCLKYYGPYATSGLFRHYVGSCSGQTPAQLYKQAGGENLFIRRANGECIRVNSVRRMGSYR